SPGRSRSTAPSTPTGQRSARARGRSLRRTNWRPRRDASSSPATRSRTTLPAAAPAWRSTSARSSPASGIRRAPTRTSSTTRPRCARSGSASARSSSSTASGRTSRSPSPSPSFPSSDSPEEGELAGARGVSGAVVTATRSEPDLRGQPPHTGLDLADVIAPRVRRAGVEALVFWDERREFRPEELEECLTRPGPEEQHVRLGVLRASLARRYQECPQIRLAVRQTGEHGHHEEPGGDSPGGQQRQRLKAEVGARRPRLE